MDRRQVEDLPKEHEELLRLALDINHLGAWQLDLVTRTVTCTPAGKAHFGLPAGAAVDFEQLFNRVHPDDRERVRQTIRDATERRTVFEFKYRTVAPSGDIRWIATRGRALYGADRQPVQIVCTTHDVTGHMRTERSLADVRDRLTRAMDYGRIGTWTIEWPAERVYTDAYIAALFSVSPEDEQGGPLKHYLDAIHPEDRDGVAAAITDAFAHGAGFYHELEYRLTRGDGNHRWVGVRYRVDADAAGEPLRMAGVLFDITGRKQAENALRDNEEKLRLAAQIAGIGIWDHDLNSGKLNWSPRCKAIFGLPPEAAIDYPTYLSRIHPDDREKVRRASLEARDPAGDGSCLVEFRTVWPDGTLHWLSSHGNYLFTGEGKTRRTIRGIGAVFDVTERKRADAERKRQQEVDRFLNRIGVVLASSLDYDKTLAQVTRLCVPRFADWAIGDVIERDGSIRRTEVVQANPAKSALARAIKDEPLPKDMLQRAGTRALLDGEPLLIPDLAARLRQDLQSDAGNARARQLLEALGPHRGSLLSVPLTARGATLGLLTLITAESGREYSRGDLTVVGELARRAGLALDNARLYRQAEEANAALREQAAALAAADERKNEFLAVLAHELRNPLAPLSANLQLLRLADGDEAVANRAHKVMERQLAHLVRLIDDLLDVARLTGGRIELRKQRIALRDAITSAVDASRGLIETKGQALSVTLLPEPLYIDADATRLTQVFANLLDNAARYTPPNGRISLTVERGGDGVAVAVRDDGAGIETRKLERIFDMFVQGDAPLRNATGGLGIGLSLAERLVKLHGGDIEAHSAGPGHGSEFIVRLPLAEPATDAKAAPPPDVDDKAFDDAAHRVLVVDDNHDVADSLSTLLGLMNKEVRTAYDGLEAVEAAAAFRPHIIFLDIGMPRLNGYDTARRIRQQPWGGDIKLIALTGWGQQEDRQRSREAGFDLHLVKPLDPAVLSSLMDGKNPVSA